MNICLRRLHAKYQILAFGADQKQSGGSLFCEHLGVHLPEGAGFAVNFKQSRPWLRTGSGTCTFSMAGTVKSR